MRVADLKVQAVLHAVGADVVSAMWLEGAMVREVLLAETADVVARADALRSELRRTVDVAAGHVPLLDTFVRGWGRELLPPDVLRDVPDVLLIVPHALLHDLPLHLVLTDSGQPLASVCGVAFCSGMSLFARCAQRNPCRDLDASGWRFEEAGAPTGHRMGRRLRAGGVDVTATGDDPYAQVARLAARHFDPYVDAVDDRLDRSHARLCFDAAGRLAGDAPDVGCIVAHGHVDPDLHQLSGLLLSAPKYPGISTRELREGEGKILYREVPFGLPPSVVDYAAVEVLAAAELEIAGECASELVCILGCSAGWARQLQCDEPASFAETLLRLGAASVIAPLWDAHVDATAAWLDGFMDAWIGAGKPKALASRDATALLLATHGPERAGALTLRGDWL